MFVSYIIKIAFILTAPLYVKEIAQPRHILSQAHHKPQKRYGEVCAMVRDLCVFGLCSFSFPRW